MRSVLRDPTERLAPRVPTLGVCLGHQAIVEAFGGAVGRAKHLVHGKASPVRHDGRGIFAGLPEEFDGLGVDTSTYLIALEEIAAVDASVAVMMSVHNSLPTSMINRFGSETSLIEIADPAGA